MPLFGSSDETLIAFIEEAKTQDADYNLRLEEMLYRNYAMNRNELRQRHGLVPLQGGETCIGQFGEVPVLRTDEELDPDATYHLMDAEPATPDDEASKKLVEWFERRACGHWPYKAQEQGLSKLSEVEPDEADKPRRVSVKTTLVERGEDGLIEKTVQTEEIIDRGGSSADASTR